MNKIEIINFFDLYADEWDSRRFPDSDKIASILDCAEIMSGCSVLDVACGTGVLFPACLDRGVSRLTGIDISPKMAAAARAKFTDPRIEVICGDVEAVNLSGYDRCVIFNAFPHFGHPDALLRAMKGSLTPNGRLTIAHDQSRERINEMHLRGARHVSLGLPPAHDLAELMELYFHVDTVVDSDIYVVSGTVSNH